MRFPTNDRHFAQYIRPEAIYQRGSFLIAMDYVKNFSCAVDVGAHVGIFSNYMAEHFDVVHAFEPEPENYKCLVENVPDNVICHNLGVAEQNVTGNMVNPKKYNSGAWEFQEDPLGAARAGPVGGHIHPGLLKIDVQGMEQRAVDGCSNAIKRAWPVIIIECGDGPVAEKLASFGYEKMRQIGGNSVWAHDPD